MVIVYIDQENRRIINYMFYIYIRVYRDKKRERERKEA